MEKGMHFRVSISPRSDSGSPLTSWVISSKLLNLSVPYFPTGTTGIKPPTPPVLQCHRKLHTASDIQLALSKCLFPASFNKLKM